MTAKHTERAFEDAIEHALLTGGWTLGSAKLFDREQALCPEEFFAFVEATQAEVWAELKQPHGASLEAGVLDALLKSLESRGMLDVLRHGLKFYGRKPDCAYFRPAHAINPDILSKYAQNRLQVTRQVHFAPAGHADEDQSVDLMLSLNGLPIATAELKNPLVTGGHP